MGKGFIKAELRRNFFRTLLKDIIGNTSILENDLYRQDANNSGFIYLNTFGNTLIRHCNRLGQQTELIEHIARDFMKMGGGP